MASLKIQIWESQNKRCYWCGCPVEFREHVPGVAIAADTATIDHVYTVWHPKRKAHKHLSQPSPFVVACHSCNNKRGGTSFKKYHEIIGKPFVEPRSPAAVLADGRQ